MAAGYQSRAQGRRRHTFARLEEVLNLEIERLKVDVRVIESYRGLGHTRVTHGVLFSVYLTDGDLLEKRSVQGTPLGPRGFYGLDQEHGLMRGALCRLQSTNTRVWAPAGHGGQRAPRATSATPVPSCTLPYPSHPSSYNSAQPHSTAAPFLHRHCYY